MSEPHPACPVMTPHGPHQVVLQHIDVGIGGRGVPEYSDCPGTTDPEKERHLRWLFGNEDVSAALGERDERIAALRRDYAQALDDIQAYNHRVAELVNLIRDAPDLQSLQERVAAEALPGRAAKIEGK